MLRRHCFDTEQRTLDEYYILTSGFPPQSDTGSGPRRAGVALFLGLQGKAAWEAVGSKWKAISPRVLSARLCFTSESEPLVEMEVICVYTPTFRATRVDKEEFRCQLQDAVRAVPPGVKVLVLVGTRHRNHRRKRL